MLTIVCFLTLLKAGSFLRAEGPEAVPAVTGGQTPAQGANSASPPPRVEFGVELRWRNEFRDNGDFRSTEDFDHFLSQGLRIHLRVRAHAHLNFYVEGQDVWLFGAERDKIIHNTATNLDQAYLDLRPGGSDQA